MSCIDYDKRLYVYWNLHKKTWSVRQSGKIVGHSDLIFLKDCRFLVGKAGQARVRREKKKNVHAGVSGYLAMNAEYPRNELGIFVMYNPVQARHVCAADWRVRRQVSYPGDNGRTRQAVCSGW
jgi:hypothetical protein